MHSDFKKPMWLDLPAFFELQSAPYLGSLKESLKQDFDGYHKIDKSLVDSLEDRQEALAKIHKFLRELEPPVHLKELIEHFLQICHDKSRYLLALKEIFTNGLHEEETLRNYHCEVQEITSLPWEPIFLTQERYYSPSLKEYWGDYWFKSLDPCHRYLPAMQKEWRETRSHQQKTPPYLLWLEQRASFIKAPWFNYFTDEEREASEVHIVEGLVKTSKGRPLSCPERQQFLFVMGLDGKIYAKRDEELLCHASFLRGRPVLASGALNAKDGKLQHIKFASGHYLSNPHQQWLTLRDWRNRGLDFGDRVRVTSFDRTRYISVMVQEEALESFAAYERRFGRR